MASTQGFSTQSENKLKQKTMCNKPIKIRNNSKYITPDTAQQLYIWINCGHCKECIQQKQNEWILRTIYEAKDTLKRGWIYFDSLTYRNDTIPRINDYLATEENYSCFNYQDIRDFYEKIRQIYGDKNIRYLITSEYGKVRQRPHYHILLFIQTNEIEPIELSKNVAKCWGKGRTDGIPYKSKKYVLSHNVLTTLNLNAIRYVAKYVTKQQTFMQRIHYRWTKLEKYYKDFKKYDKLKIKAIKREYYKHTNPFHRQSQHFGETALEEIPYKHIMGEGTMYYRDDSLNVIKYIAIPDYFKRKLWQTQIKYNGKRIWINTEEGIKAKKEMEERIKSKLLERLQNLNRQQGLNHENKLEELTEYILFKRGRLNGTIDYKAHHEEAQYFNYTSDRDLKYIGKQGISTKFIGNDKIGYCTTEFEETNLEDQIYINDDLEKIINEMMIYKDTTTLVILKEHMAEIKKMYFKQ